jgi:hypothetical protein
MNLRTDEYETRGPMAQMTEPFVYPTEQDFRQDTTTDTRHDLLIQHLEEQNRFLREQLEAATTAQAEQRRVIMALTQRIPELGPGSSQEAPESPVAADDVGEVPEPPSRPRRSFWRRIFK